MPDIRLLIVQPYLPKYRVPFFESLIAQLAGDGIDCRVTASRVPGAHANRGDAGHAPWIIETTRHRVKMLGKSFGSMGSGPARRGADAVIVGLQSSQVDPYRAILERRTLHTRVGVWGHVKSYVNKSNHMDERLERWLARNADHVFAYTPSGARHAQGYGISPTRITSVMNSVDVSGTLAALNQLDEQELLAFQQQHHIDPTNAASFIGGLDQPKRVGFLQDALDHIWHRDRNFKLLIGGNGVDADILQPSVARGQVVMLGYAGEREKAFLARSSTVLAMPGRIGLVAVESLALGLPVVTTNWPYHAPEYEYLTEGTSRFSSDNDPRAYADLLLEQIARQATVPRPVFEYPLMADMVNSFTLGIKQMLS
jgi:glycosyltransferase involved in cell wall biosynthesis